MNREDSLGRERAEGGREGCALLGSECHASREWATNYRVGTRTQDEMSWEEWQLTTLISRHWQELYVQSISCATSYILTQ